MAELLDHGSSLGAATALGLDPGQVMMVAAHKGDLRAAQANGLRTAFVERPLEKGPAGGADLLPDPQSDIEATDFIDLAESGEFTPEVLDGECSA